MENQKTGLFDRDLNNYYQSDVDFQKSIDLWKKFDLEEVFMTEEELLEAHSLLPEVKIENLKKLKAKVNKPCSCGRKNDAFDLIKFSLSESIHGARFLSSILNETHQDKKISIMDSVHKSPELPDSVIFIDNTKDVPCANCGKGVHMYIIHPSIAHYWH